jgi:hypothetical protein
MRVTFRQLCHQTANRFWRTIDVTEEAHLTVAASVGDRHRNLQL